MYDRPPSPPCFRSSSSTEQVKKEHEAKLKGLISVLQSSVGLKMYKIAHRQNMIYKQRRYGELQQEAERDGQKQVEILNIKIPELKKLAGVEGVNDNWNIFESQSEMYHEAKDRAASFEALKIRAMQRMEGSMSFDEVKTQDAIKQYRDELVKALLGLLNFSSQSHVVDKAVTIVASFIKDPTLFRTKLMNFMLIGGAGTGKTTLASAIGDVFAKAGIFVGNKLVEAGRAELVGQYEGQTVARTRAFLTNNLDSGVVFIDEAYAITPWQDGKPEGYGSEAATAMVEFMTRYPGLYCIIVAGYEKEMTRYFLPTNEGLSRRFPNKYVLQDMTTEGLIWIFQQSLLKAQGIPTPNGKDAPLVSSNYFTAEAWSYLHNIVEVCMGGEAQYVEEYDQATRKTYRNVRMFRPTWEYMYAIFQNQAGSMTNLADEAITVLLETISFQEVMQTQKKMEGARPLIGKQTKEVMRSIILQTILKSSLSQADLFLTQLTQIESSL